MPTNLTVRTKDPQGSALADVTVAWHEASGAEQAGTRSGDEVRFEGVPDDKEIFVKVSRTGAPDLEVLLNLGRRGNRRFVRGRPTVMHLAPQRGRRRGRTSTPRHVLSVTLHEPQEVILCAGADTHNHRRSPFVGVALRRFGRMARRSPSATAGTGIVQVNRSCVLTLFEFNGAQSHVYHMLPGVGTRDLPAGRSRARAVTMTKETLPLPGGGQKAGVVDVYNYLNGIGQSRPGKVMALEFLSHAYWIGPILENTNRSRDDAAVCMPHCPVGSEHGAIVSEVPPYIPYVHYEGKNQLIRNFQPRVVLRERVSTIVRLNQRTVEGPHQQRVAEDLDPRNTDFAVLPSATRENAKKALHSNAVLRVWGCSNGDMGPRWRRFARGMDSGAKNELVTVRSSYNPRSGSVPQTWKVRREDVRLMYLSQARRTYGQAIANALERDCFTAVPGTWSNYNATRLLGGMEVHPGMVRSMRRLSRQYLGVSASDEDEAGYYRFAPNPPKQRAEVKVLVTGFAPFLSSPKNAAGDSVALLRKADIESSIVVPPWLELSFDLQKDSNVDVVWTCQAARERPERPARQNHPAVRGGLGILDKARQINADIVLIVGESGDISSKSKHVRIEQFANNKGSSFTPDNDGNKLQQDGPIFTGGDQTMESLIPRLTWARIIKVLSEENLGVHKPGLQTSEYQLKDDGSTLLHRSLPGEYICNESFYHLLLDSRARHPLRPASPSGRWVWMIHVGAYRTDAKIQELAKALSLIIRGAVEDMIWATEIYGRQGKIPVGRPAGRDGSLLTPF